MSAQSVTERPGTAVPARGGGPRPRHARARRRRSLAYRRVRALVLLTLAVFLVLVSVSLGSALLNPANGTTLAGRFAEWARTHGGASVVRWAEKEWF